MEISRPSPKSRQPARRRAGRPSGDGPDLRERLLEAALTCFSRHGIAATPLRAIAAEAGVNPALLHYYFGDKGQLQQAVIEERVMPAVNSIGASLAAAGDDVAGLIVAFVRGVGEAVTRHPWLPSLWVREVLCEGGALRDLLVNRVGPQIPQLLAQRFAAAQRAGALNPDLDPRLLVVSLVGLTLFPAASAPVWGRVFETDGIDADVLRDHTIALLDRGLGAG
ncbi:MAG: TetR/AcrR family transcriptional regulator [Lysobacter sp.]